MLQVIRALELPAEQDLLPNTIYLTPEYSEDGSLDHFLSVTVTGTNTEVYRTSVSSVDVQNWISDAVLEINEGPNGNDGLNAAYLKITAHDSRLDGKDTEIAGINDLILGKGGVADAHARIDVLRDDLDTAVIAAGGNSTTYTDTKHAEALAGIAAVQAELDVTQSGLGLNAAGQFIARGVYDGTENPTGANYIGTATSVIGAVNTLDSTIKSHRDQSLASITSLNNALTAAGQSTGDAIGALDTRVTAIETEINDVIHPELGNLASALSTETGQRTGEDANIRGEIAVHVGDLTAVDQDLQTQITVLTGEIAGVGSMANGISNALGNAITALDVRVTTAEADIDALETASAATNAAAGTLATRVTTAEADIGALETGLAATNATVTANAAAATTYTNTKHAEALAYADSAVATAVGSLDLSNTAVYAADIAARDALVLTKSSFVMVANATGDATVAAGAALYFYNLATRTYVKVAEYESMDLFPNQAVLQDISDVGGQLYYKGAAVATVHNTVNEW